jgi:hypothetical protein
MPTFIPSINDNKILREKIAFCIKISLKLMGTIHTHQLKRLIVPLNEKNETRYGLFRMLIFKRIILFKSLSISINGKPWSFYP